MESVFLAGLLSMSSTTVVLKSFDEMKLKDKPYAPMVFGTLVVEDLIAILLMVLLSTMAVAGKFAGGEMLFNLGKLAFFLILWFLVGIYVIPTLLKKARPYINDDILYQLFSYRAELVKTLYLTPLNGEYQRQEPWVAPFNAFGGPNTFYQLRPEYDTQRKIQAAFADKTSQEDIALRDGLYRLVSNVLFVIDHRHPHHYHPRIAAQQDYAYRDLSDQQKRAFNHLYDDYYYRRHNQFWYDEAMKKLPHLTQSTRMLVCAEDLGMVPQCVEWVMNDLRMLSLEIQTMPKAFGIEFGRLTDNPYRSVATISTHDMPTMRQWWEEDAERAQRFYNNALHIDGTAPQQQPAWLSEEIVKRHLYCPSMLCLLSLQDWLAIDADLRNPDAAAERINIPAHPRHYWRWRMHLTLEQLEQHTAFGQHIRSLIEQAGRR
jgi:4-alpha-glucanotransferase